MVKKGCRGLFGTLPAPAQAGAYMSWLSESTFIMHIWTSASKALVLTATVYHPAKLYLSMAMLRRTSKCNTVREIGKAPLQGSAIEQAIDVLHLDD